MLQPVDRDAAVDEDPVDLGHDVACRALRQRDAEPVRFDRDVRAERSWRRATRAARVGVGALDLQLEGRAGQELGDRSLPDDLAAVDDGDGVAGALHLVEEVRGQDDGAALGDEREDHVAHLEHAAGVEAVHRLVEDQQLRVAEQAGGDAEPLAHAHGVLRHLVVGPVQDADPLERRVDAAPSPPARAPRRGSAGSAARSGGRGSGARRRWPRRGPAPGHGAAGRVARAATWCRRRRGSGRAAPGSGSSCPPRWARDTRRRTPGDQELDAVNGDVVPEPLRQAVGLDRPLASPRGAETGSSAQGGRGHTTCPSDVGGTYRAHAAPYTGIVQSARRCDC